MGRIFQKLWQDFKEYFILVVLLIISLVVISINQKPAVKKVRAVAFGSFAALSSVVNDVISIAQLKNENENLRKNNAELMLQISQLREYGIVNDELKRLLEIKDTTRFPLVPASIVSKAFSRSQSVLTINAGSEQGIQPGMPVINDHGFVGVVNNVAGDYSIVRTLKSLDLKLAVKDERSRVDGLMKWNGTDLVIVNVPKTYDIEAGDRIIVSELSSIVSLPVPVGVVKELSQVERGIFNEVKVQPYVDLSRVENVFVIKLIQSRQKNDLELNFYNLK
jgi:rod shape-determining protein MreC